MADDARRRRGRRRGRKDDGHRAARATEEPQLSDAVERDLDAAAEPAIPGVNRRPRFRFRRRSAGPDGAKERPRKTDRAPAAGGSANVSPMDFWRTGAARSYREAAPVAQKKRGLAGIFSNFYVPPWAPVVGIIVFGILGLLFFLRSATGAPRINDHWHATYTFHACGEKQPPATEWHGTGVHTHGDSVLHIHPFQTFEEGAGARLVKWFEYGKGELKNDKIRMPGIGTDDQDNIWENGEKCPDGKEGVLQVYVTRAGQSGEERLQGRDLERYIPHDGDVIRFVFGPPEETVQQEDRTIIPAEQATAERQITVTDDGSTNEANYKFDPASIQLTTGEVTKLVIKNTGQVSHGFRVIGADGEWGTVDDFVSEPDIILPAAEGVAIVRLNAGGEVEFRDDVAQGVTGKLVVTQAPAGTPSPTPAPADVDVTLDVVMKDNLFEPAGLTLGSGQKFRINLNNQGSFAHNMRIDGPDGEFQTDDDILSDPSPLRPGQTGELVGQIDDPGTYRIRDDFHPAEQTGTLVVE